MRKAPGSLQEEDPLAPSPQRRGTELVGAGAPCETWSRAGPAFAACRFGFEDASVLRGRSTERPARDFARLLACGAGRRVAQNEAYQSYGLRSRSGRSGRGRP